MDGAIFKYSNSIWQRAKSKVNASDPMDYWGAWASQNSQTVPPEVADSFFTTVGLLKNEDGRCEAWARFFSDMLSVQGITTWELKVITPKETFIKVPELLLIKEWSSTVVPPPLISTVPPTAIGSIDAQGDSDPQQIFSDHVVVGLTGSSLIYDPSYGGQSSANLSEWEDKSLDFLQYKHTVSGETFWELNTPGDEQTILTPIN